MLHQPEDLGRTHTWPSCLVLYGISPRPALTLLEAQLCLSAVTSCHSVITLRERDYNVTGFTADLHSSCSAAHAHIHGFIEYIINDELY